MVGNDHQVSHRKQILVGILEAHISGDTHSFPKSCPRGGSGGEVPELLVMPWPGFLWCPVWANQTARQQQAQYLEFCSPVLAPFFRGEVRVERTATLEHINAP